MQEPLSKLQLAELKNKAARLVIMDGLTQKEAAKQIGVSEKTVSKWAQKHHWAAAAESYLINSPAALLNVTAFSDYLKAADENAYNVFKKHLEAYMKDTKENQGWFWIV